MSEYMDGYKRRVEEHQRGVEAARKKYPDFTPTFGIPQFAEAGEHCEMGHCTCHAPAINALFEQYETLWVAFAWLREQYEQAALLSPRTRLIELPSVGPYSAEAARS